MRQMQTQRRQSEGRNHPQPGQCLQRIQGAEDTAAEGRQLDEHGRAADPGGGQRNMSAGINGQMPEVPFRKMRFHVIDMGSGLTAVDWVNRIRSTIEGATSFCAGLLRWWLWGLSRAASG